MKILCPYYACLLFIVSCRWCQPRLAKGTVVEYKGKTVKFSVREIWLCDFPLFPLLPVVTWLSCLQMLIWPCVYSLCVSSSCVSSSPLSLTPLPLSSSAHLPHISVFVPGCWQNTDGPGSGRDVNLRERCLLWFFSLSRGNTSCVSVCHIPIIARWNLFFKLWKLPVSANCGFVYRYLSQCCAQLQTQSLLLTLCRLLCGIWQRACCSVD